MVVGISGTIAPMMPSPTQANPSASQPRRAARLTGLCRTGSREAVIGQVAKVRAARARDEALTLNREGQFKKAPAVIKAEMAQLMEFGDLSAVKKEVASLRGLLSSFAGPMDAIDAKKMRMASYAVRRSRHDPSA